MNLRGLVVRRIEEARDKGKFKNLKGEGLPQQIEENPYEDPEMRVAHKILSNAGFCPPWIELTKEIDADDARALRIWDEYRAHRKRQMDAIHRGTVTHFAELITDLDEKRDRALKRLETLWLETNIKINYLNATVPSDSVKRIPIGITRRRQRFEREFPRLGGVTSGRYSGER